MRLRHITAFAALVSLAAAGAHAADDKKKCTTPPAECERIIRQMLSGRRYLGVQIVELSPGIAIKSVVEDGPAQRADLRPGDRLMAVNGKSTTDATINDFKQILAEASKTGRLWMIVQRHGILKPVEARMEVYSKAQIDKIVAQHLAEAHGIGAAPAQP